MADEPARSGSWWATIPGILTASAAVITAATGLLAILAQNGVFGEKNKNLVSEKATAVREAVTPATPPAASEAMSIAKPATAAATPSIAAGSTALTQRDGAATGVSTAPLRAVPFTGAVVTLVDGSTVKLRDDIKEYYNGPVLKTTTGQTIEMQRIRRFELTDWKNHIGTARVTLTNGESIDVRIEAYSLSGSNDLGDFSSDFAKIRSVEFVR
ncbi:MAG: hypothetical protein ACR2GP_10535 [Burkholderiaceae bacterium]